MPYEAASEGGASGAGSARPDRAGAAVRWIGNLDRRLPTCDERFRRGRPVPVTLVTGGRGFAWLAVGTGAVNKMLAKTLMDRKPRGYRGENHETIGSDILAVLDAVTLPEATLGEDLVKELRAIEPDRWYPIEPLLGAMEQLDVALGHFGLVKMGRRLWERTHRANAEGQFASVADLLLAFTTLYRSANRGRDIGGWEVRMLAPGRAILDKSTPHHCAMEQGLIIAATGMLGVNCTVKQTACFRQGDELCTYELTSTTRDDRWMGKHEPFG